MDLDTRPNSAPALPLLSRPDTVTEQIIETAVRMVMEVGLTAAENYLRNHGVGIKTSLRVLGHNPRARRRPR